MLPRKVLINKDITQNICSEVGLQFWLDCRKYLLVEVIAWGRVKLRINITRIFKVGEFLATRENTSDINP